MTKCFIKRRLCRNIQTANFNNPHKTFKALIWLALLKRQILLPSHFQKHTLQSGLNRITIANTSFELLSAVSSLLELIVNFLWCAKLYLGAAIASSFFFFWEEKQRKQMASTKQRRIRPADVSAPDIYKVNIRRMELGQYNHHRHHHPKTPHNHLIILSICVGKNGRRNNVSVHGCSFSQTNNSTAGRESFRLEVCGWWQNKTKSLFTVLRAWPVEAIKEDVRRQAAPLASKVIIKGGEGEERDYICSNNTRNCMQIFALSVPLLYYSRVPLKITMISVFYKSHSRFLLSRVTALPIWVLIWPSMHTISRHSFSTYWTHDTIEMLNMPAKDHYVSALSCDRLPCRAVPLYHFLVAHQCIWMFHYIKAERFPPTHTQF